MKALEFIRDGFSDSSMVALKEWTGPNGEMGVYQSQDYGYIYVLVLVDAQKRIYTYQQYSSPLLKDQALLDAKIWATFAGAIEVQP